jgi:hypothetical protein
MDIPQIDMSDLTRKVQGLRKKTVSDSSRSQYDGHQIKFIRWIWDFKPDILSSHFRDLAQNYIESSEREKKEFIQEYLSRAPDDPPLRFDILTSDVFMCWIVSLRKNDGSRPGYDSCNSKRAALYDLHRRYRARMSVELSSGIKDTYVGLKREINESQHTGNEPVKVGKDPMPFDVYRYLSLSMLQRKEKEFIFSRCFMILCWNLMARASNVFSICHSHMEWRDDSLCVYFAHMKNDQFGKLLQIVMILF